MHKNLMPSAAQADEVDRVKRSESGHDRRNPITLRPDTHPMREAMAMMRRYPSPACRS
jgi:hypothetical protein